MTTRSDLLGLVARRRPDAPALESGGECWSYRELDRRVDAIAATLAELHPSAPSVGTHRLALVLERRLDAVLLLHAGPRAGFVVAPLSSGLTASELSAAFAELDPSAVFCGPGTRSRVADAAGNRPVKELGDACAATAPGVKSLTGPARKLPAAPPGAPAVEILEGAQPPDVPYVLWTSGTSGRPRGVLLTGSGLAAVARGSADRLDLGHGDRWLTTLSPAHVGGLATVVRAAHLSATLVVRDAFDEDELLDLASRGEVTHASLVPLMLRRLLERGAGRRCPPGLRCLLVGGARTPPELVREAVRLGYPVALTYGMTETSSQAATASPETARRKPHAVGPPIPGVEIRIAEDGEILIRGASLAAGYLPAGPRVRRRDGHPPSAGHVLSAGHPPSAGDAPSAGAPPCSAKGAVSLPLDEEGWFHTGDLGRIDTEGHLVVTGRRSERIVTGGVAVDPLEVEAVLRGLAEIREAAVVGLPNEEWGERVAAALVLEGSAVPAAEAASPQSGEAGGETIERIGRAVRDLLAGPKRPRVFTIVEALPRTPSGKVDRKRVRRLFERTGDERREDPGSGSAGPAT